MKKYFCAIAVIMTLCCVTLVSCDKIESISSEGSSFSNSDQKSTSKDELLSTEFTVAFAQGELVDGDELQLTFDKDKFLDTYEEYLSEGTGKKWVAENVKAYAQMMKSGEILPMLQVSAFDVDDETGDNTFIVLRRANTGKSIPASTFSYCADIAITVTCTASGPACTSDEKFCHLTETENGGLTCSWCPVDGCTRTETATIVVQSICRSIFAAL